MKRLIRYVVAAAFICVSGSVSAQVGEMKSPNVISARMLLGGATGFISASDNFNADDPMMRFAGGGEIAFNRYFSDVVALNVGFGLLGKGYRQEVTFMGDDYKGWAKFMSMEIPFGVLLNFSGFHVGLDMVTTYLVSGKVKVDGAGSSSENAIDNWDGVRRVNLCPRVSLAYAIPAGKIAVVPGVMWEIDALNIYDGSDDTPDDTSYRHMNLMFSLGIDFGL